MASMAPRKRLGEMLVEAGIIGEDQLHAALRHQRQWGGRLGAILIELKLAGEDAIVDALAVKLGLEIARLEHLEPYAFEQAKGLVPREWAIRNRVFPVAADTGHLVVAMADPSNLALTDELAFRTGRRVKACIAGERAIDAALRAHLGAEPPGQREAIALDAEDDAAVEAVYDPIGATSSDQLAQFFQQGGAAEARAPSAPPAPPAETFRGRPRTPAELQLEDQRTESIPLVQLTPMDLPEAELQPLPVDAAVPDASAEQAAWAGQEGQPAAGGYEGQEGPAAPRELTPEELELLEAIRRLAAGDDTANALLPRARLAGALLRIMLRKQWITEQELLDELAHG